MKKNLFMVAAVALMAFVSCSKEDFTSNDVQEVASDIVFVAESDATRTALGAITDGVTAVNWVGNEKININGVEFSTTSVGARAEFSTTKAFDETAATFDAIYPSTAGTSLTAVEIPALQEGTFAEASISVATSTTQSLRFKNLASILKFHVPADAEIVTISSESNLAGTVSVTFDETGLPVIGAVTGASKEVTVKANGGFKTGTDYYVAVLPGVHKFTIKIDGYLSKASTKTPTIERASLKDMGTLPIPAEWAWFVTSASSKQYMLKSDVYTDLYVLKNVSLSTAKKFRFVSSDGKKTVGAYGKSGDVDCKGQINQWYNSDATTDYAANIFISTTANYDVYFSPADLNFLIIKAGVEEENSKWEVVGWINNKDSWGGGSGHVFKYNFITTELSITMALTSSDYFKILKNKNWTAGTNGGWVGAPGNDGGTKDYTIAVGATQTIATYHSYDNHKAQFHMKNNGTYKIVLSVSDNAYTSATVKITRTK